MTFANINNKNIHFEYIDNQHDKVFIFINSLGTDFRIWDQIVEILKPETNILRYDKAGHGLSENFEFIPQIKDYAADLLALMDYLKIEKAIIVGLSIGGIIAQYLGIYHSNRVEKLILCNTAPKVGTAESWNTRINIVKNKGLASIADTIMKVWFSDNFHNSKPQDLAGCKTMLTNSNSDGYIHACEALKNNDLSEKIGEIKLPTLCIGGCADGSTPPETVKAMAQKIPNAAFELIDGVGHIPCVEAPQILAKHIINFIK